MFHILQDTRKARLAHGVTVAESKTGGIIYAVGGSAEVDFIMMRGLELLNITSVEIL